MNQIKNIILITIDALRADYLGFYGYSKETSPTIDNLAESGVSFLEAYSTGPGTTVSLISLLTAEYPRMYSGYHYLSGKRTSVAEVFRNHGYDTAAFHSNAFISKEANYNKGFDTFMDLALTNSRKYKLKSCLEGIFGKHSRIYKSIYRFAHWYARNVQTKAINLPSRKASYVNECAVSWLEKNPQKFFLWLHYMDTHAPLLPPEEYTKDFHGEIIDMKRMIHLWHEWVYNREQISDEDLKDYIALYDSSIRYVDDTLKGFFDTLKDMHLWENTIIVVTADHGEEFREHGDLGHRPKLYNELLHVPLILKCPGYETTIIETPISLLDLAPTLVDLAGLKPVDSWCGRSLLPLVNGHESNYENRIVISEVSHERGNPQIVPDKLKVAIRKNNWKYIYSRENNSYELYDLKVDPKELHNRYQGESEVVDI
ncbi:TPA: DUF4976 domain-containing protein [Candidatus Poribacteria bacterium]|nr:DUF4976 domain-containing protein [Candidatus Poribacteria bacterium]